MEDNFNDDNKSEFSLNTRIYCIVTIFYTLHVSVFEVMRYSGILFPERDAPLWMFKNLFQIPVASLVLYFVVKCGYHLIKALFKSSVKLNPNYKENGKEWYNEK